MIKVYLPSDFGFEYDFASQDVGLPSIFNARQLGGYVLPDGSRVKQNLLLRGGALSAASRDDLDVMKQKYNVRYVFDFRTTMEVDRSPDKPVQGSSNMWLPTIDESGNVTTQSLPAEAYSDLVNWLSKHSLEEQVLQCSREIYTSLVDNEYTQLQYAAFLQTIVGMQGGAVYWHCSQGKDRTGLGSAFLLAALGANRDLIMADYAVSNDYYKKDISHAFSVVQTDAERDVMLTFVGANARYFELGLDLIDEKYGSMTEYLRGPLCLTAEDETLLKERYLEY